MKVNFARCLCCVAIFLFCPLGAEPLDIDVFMAADDGNAMQTCVTIASLLKNTTDDERIHLRIVGDGMSEENKNGILSLKTTIRDFDVEWRDFDMGRLEQFNTEIWHKSIMIKLFVAELFPDLDRILWLDDDVLVLKNIRELYEKDLTGKYLATVEMSEIFTLPLLKKQHPKGQNLRYWLTAGMGLYNIQEIRQDGIQDKFMEHALEYGKICKILCKDGLNGGGIEEYALTKAISREKALILPYEYLPTFAFKGVEKEYAPAYNNAVILHYSGRRSKPWKDKNNLEPKYIALWRQYFAMTPFAQDPKFSHIYRIGSEQQPEQRKWQNHRPIHRIRPKHLPIRPLAQKA
jgi:lipopolysaccharide biosynthesis glycosyltransferase